MFGKAQSTEVKAGQILILIAVIIKVVSIFLLFALNSVLPGLIDTNIIASQYLGGAILALGVISVLGLAAGVYTYQLAYNRKIRQAGLFAVIASLLPPLDIIMLIGAILFLISSEGKK
jgi:hypothetical protein